MKTENDNFWTDERLIEFIRFTQRSDRDNTGYYSDIAEFKKSKLQSVDNKRDWEIIAFDKDDLNKRYEANIKSVKRLSDNEVFSIGETVIRNNYADKIYSFEIRDNEMFAIFCNEETCGAFRLSELAKQKQPLFITSDNVPIYEGDKIWFVFNDLTPQENAGFKDKWKLVSSKADHEYNCGNKYYKVFSSMDKAQDYILMNKRELNLNDVIDNLPALSSEHRNSTLIIKLKELVKEKLSK